MPILHLGVADVPYVNPPQSVKRGRKPKKAKTPNQTTGDVAEILEDKYHIMRVFYEEHKSDIALSLESALAGSLENLLLGASPSNAPFAEGTNKIKSLFQRFIDDKEMDRLGIPGVPTEASLLGIDHRLQKGNRRPGRPSFQDTAIYESSFESWVD
jgi:hypothetical protein